MLDILILEDDAEQRLALETYLRTKGATIRHAPTIAEATARVNEKMPDLVFADLNLPDGSGLELLEAVHSIDPEVDVVMISGQTTIDAAIDALRLGATDWLKKPADTNRLSAVLASVQRRVALKNEVRDLRGRLKSLGRFQSMVGASRAMQDVYDCIERVAPTEETVFLVGETGTGKEVTSRTIHELSRRRENAFVPVNCGAIAVNLIESEFFGHEKGAFTGADKQRKGYFEQAHGGTLFLDEITEMPIELQVKLLRALESRQITRVGGNDLIDVDIRIIAATNRDPHEAVDDGKLRQDLLYRLMVFRIDLPPLRDREGDIALLAQAILDSVNNEYEVSKAFDDSTLARLATYSWPGNVRELVNCVRRSHIMAKDDVILPSHLPDIDGGPASPTSASTPGSQGDGIGVRPGMSIAEAERLLIEATLEQNGGDKRQAAETLGISLKTLYSRLQVYAAARADD
ncbi:MAG: sigma-54-dependent Fis family transcriptional regulator [Planctomycetes bacterium]|nr:sigma-54-dependent Fis family transcriptional regulator [Planctomycetota bacterium]